MDDHLQVHVIWDLRSICGSCQPEKHKTEEQDLRVHWPLELVLHDANETCITQACSALFPDLKGLAKLLTRTNDGLSPESVEVIWGHGPIIRDRFDRMLYHLNVASRFEATPALPKELVPIRYAAEQLPHVNENELVFRIGPRERHIVNLEYAVRRDERRLNRRQVYSGNFGTGIFICHVS